MLAAGASLAIAVVSSGCAVETESIEPAEAEVIDAPTPIPPPPGAALTKCAAPGDCSYVCGGMACLNNVCVAIDPLPDATPCVLAGSQTPHFCRSGYCVAGCNVVADCPNVVCRTETCETNACDWIPENGTSCVNGTKPGICQNGGCISN
jgi:hypothetical protein